MEYVVKATCYFGNRYYRKGATVEFDSTVKVPDHFEPLTALETKPLEVVERPTETRKRVTKAKGKTKNG